VYPRFLAAEHNKMLEDRLAVAKSLALEAGTILRQGYHGEKDISHKGRLELLTQFDLMSEQLITKGIRESFPQDYIVAEEENAPITQSDYWLIDPLDGTTNFAHGLPGFTISLAYLLNHRPVLGVLYLPILNELFSALHNHGSFLNDVDIEVTKQTSLKHSLLATGFPYAFDQVEFDSFGNWERLFYQSRGLRHLGCASLNLAYVACGRLDGFWECGFKPWDMAAGIILVQEAGGSVTRIDGGDNPLIEPTSILATNGHLHKPITDLIK
jgi:myo-inositol-1(or 4)-monophosphatase